MAEDKMVKEADLIAFKKSAESREKKFKQELEELNKRVADAEAGRRQVESQLKITKVDLEDDEEVKKVREFLLNEDKRIENEAKKLQERLDSFTKRERGVMAKELAFEMKSKGVELKEEALLEAEDMKAKAAEVYTEFLVQQNENLKRQGSPA